jgi:hypothetical protein
VRLSNFNPNHFNGKDSSPSKLLKSFAQDYLYQVLKPLSVGDIQGTMNMLKFTLAVYIEFISTKLAGFLQQSSENT